MRITAPHGSRANVSDDARRVVYLHYMAREVLKQLYGEWADGSFFGPEGLDNLRAMVEQAGGVDRLAAHDVRLGDDGLMFVGSPATPTVAGGPSSTPCPPTR